MKTFIVEVPVYLSLTITAPTDDADHLAQLALDYVVDDLGAARNMVMKWPLADGAVVLSQRIELLDVDEDRTPDVYDETRRTLLNPPDGSARPIDHRREPPR